MLASSHADDILLLFFSVCMRIGRRCNSVSDRVSTHGYVLSDIFEMNETN